jgi:sugar phosphate isomerase/epimerase
MELGAITVQFLDRPWEAALDYIQGQGIRLIEPCAGGHLPKLHYDPIRLNADQALLDAFRRSVDERGLQIDALACHGNPLHPQEARRRAHDEDFRATCELAGKLGVRRVDVISGCPGGGPSDRTVNWIINSIFPEYREAYAWQWHERAIPYWKGAAEHADRYGVKICIKPHAGDLVYNADTLLRLRDAVGPTIGATVDPSHLFWMGIDPPTLIEALGDAVYYAHAKDASFDVARVRSIGLVPGCDYDDWAGRSWIYRAVGYGHPEAFWRDYVTALRRVGYDDGLMIEIEDPYMTADDAFAKSAAILRVVMPGEPSPKRNWFENYGWQDAGTE